jgi:hypothetical protein
MKIQILTLSNWNQTKGENSKNQFKRSWKKMLSSSQYMGTEQRSSQNTWISIKDSNLQLYRFEFMYDSI